MPSAFLYLFFLWVLLNAQFIFPVWARRRASQAGAPTGYIAPRWNSYLRSILILACQAGVALLIGHLTQLQIFGSANFELKTVFLALSFLVLNMGIMDPVEWKHTSDEVKKRMIAFLPQNAKERLIWIPVSLSASLGEEIVFRAVFFGLLYRLTGRYWVAGTASSMLFGFSHRGDGLISVGSTFFVGLVLQWFVYVSGGLYISIAVHFIHNYFALVYGIKRKQLTEVKSPVAKESEAAPTK